MPRTAARRRYGRVQAWVPTPENNALVAFLWAMIAAIIVLYIFFAAFGGFDPSEAKTTSVMVAVLAILWLAHAWKRLFSTQNTSPRPDRERRGLLGGHGLACASRGRGPGELRRRDAQVVPKLQFTSGLDRHRPAPAPGSTRGCSRGTQRWVRSIQRNFHSCDWLNEP